MKKTHFKAAIRIEMTLQGFQAQVKVSQQW
jgi:hypothetical protein